MPPEETPEEETTLDRERREIIERLQKADVNVAPFGETDDDEDAIKTQPVAILSMRGLRKVDATIDELIRGQDAADAGDVPGEF